MTPGNPGEAAVDASPPAAARSDAETRVDPAVNDRAPSHMPRAWFDELLDLALSVPVDRGALTVATHCCSNGPAPPGSWWQAFRSITPPRQRISKAVESVYKGYWFRRADAEFIDNLMDR